MFNFSLFSINNRKKVGKWAESPQTLDFPRFFVPTFVFKSGQKPKKVGTSSFCMYKYFFSAHFLKSKNGHKSGILYVQITFFHQFCMYKLKNKSRFVCTKSLKIACAYNLKSHLYVQNSHLYVQNITNFSCTSQNKSSMQS